MVRYLQLAHNEWDPAAKTSRMKVLYSFGRAEDLDRAAIARLIGSLSRLLGQASVGLDSLENEAGAAAGLSFVASRPMGGAYVLDALWTRLGVAKTMRTMPSRTRRDATVERVLFALVANRALAPSSKLAATSWVAGDVHIAGLPEVSDDACYRAMDWLLEVEPALAKEVYASTADLINLQVDLLFFDTPFTYVETETGDEPLWRDAKGNPAATTTDTADDDELPQGAVKQAGFGTYGKSKDHREDLPQVVVGMAVTREGIPVRVWCWPGNTNDSALIRQVKDDMRDWNLARVVWVADRGFTSAENRRYLQRAGGGYILGEKLRSGSSEATAALGRAGRYQDVAGNMRVKEVRISEHERFVIAHNPEAADRDALVRAALLQRLTEMIKNSDKMTPTKRAELRGVISTKPGLNRYLRLTPTGLLRIDAAAITAETKLDGKYLLRSSDPHLCAEDIALGYKQLLEVERGWRDMKQILDLRPVHHRLEDRIRAHVVLCWLALLLIRIIETTTGDTWNNIRRELQRLHVGTFTGPVGTYRQTTDLTSEQAKILAQLDITAPPRILDLATTAS
ncbi:MAG: IS1634 family transposase [Dermatophilaceae bacterium]